MARNSASGNVLSTLGQLAWPLILGSGITVGFFGLVFGGPLEHPLILRYFAGHPVSMVETALFFIGLVALAMKGQEVLAQLGISSQIDLGETPKDAGPDVAVTLLDRVAAWPSRVRKSYLGRRLTEALETIERKNSVEGLDAELKYLADMDVGRQQDSYSLVRIVIWATPMLGFLGTVMGITQALGDLDPKALASDIETAMQGLLSGLYVAFDTTAVALSFSMGLMFLQFLLDRVEVQQLAEVDARVAEELLTRFETSSAGGDPQVAAVQRMATSVLQATQQLVQRQVEVWQQTVNAAHNQWSQLADSNSQQLTSALQTALSQSLEEHHKQLARVEQHAGEQLQRRWEQWQTVLSDNARLLHAQQQEMVRQGEVMQQVLRAAGEVTALEHALNSNLSALAGSRNFEETVMSLSAAIHLLSARLGHQPASSVDLKSPPAKGRAA